MAFETSIVERLYRFEKSLVNGIIVSYLQQVSTMKIQDVLSHPGIDHDTRV